MPAAKTATKSVKAAPQTTTAPKPAAAAAAQASAAKETVEKAATAAASDAFGFAEKARDQYTDFLKAMNENAEKFSGATQEMMEESRERMEQAQARFQEMGAEAMETARQDMTDAVDFANELARAKTMGDALEIQRDYWTRFFETRMERTKAMTEQMVEATRETVEPFTKTPFTQTTTAFPMPFSAAAAFDADAFKAFFPFAAR